LCHSVRIFFSKLLKIRSEYPAKKAKKILGPGYDRLPFNMRWKREYFTEDLISVEEESFSQFLKEESQKGAQIEEISAEKVNL